MGFSREEKIKRLREGLSVFGSETQDSYAEMMSFSGPLVSATQYTLSPNFSGGRALLTAADLNNAQIILDDRKKDPAARDGADRGKYSDNITRVSTKVVGVWTHAKLYSANNLAYQGTLGLGSKHDEDRNFYYASKTLKPLAEEFNNDLAHNLMPRTRAKDNLILLAEGPGVKDASRKILKDIYAATGDIYITSATTTSNDVIQALASKARAGNKVVVKFGGQDDTGYESKAKDLLASAGVTVLEAKADYQSHENITALEIGKQTIDTIGTLRLSKSAFYLQNQTNSTLRVTDEKDLHKAIIEEVIGHSTPYNYKVSYNARGQELVSQGYVGNALNLSLYNTLPSVLPGSFYDTKNTYYKNQRSKGHALDEMRNIRGPYSNLYSLLYKTQEVPSIYRTADSELNYQSVGDSLNAGVSSGGQALRLILGGATGASVGIAAANLIATTAPGMRAGRLTLGVAGGLIGAYALLKVNKYTQIYNDQLGIPGSMAALVGKGIDSVTTSAQPKALNFTAMATGRYQEDQQTGFFESMTTGVYSQAVAVFQSAASYAAINYPIKVLLSKQNEATLQRIADSINAGDTNSRVHWLQKLAMGQGEFAEATRDLTMGLHNADVSGNVLARGRAYRAFTSYLRQASTSAPSARQGLEAFGSIAIVNAQRKTAQLLFEYGAAPLLTSALAPKESNKVEYINAVNRLHQYIGQGVEGHMIENSLTGLKEFAFKYNSYEYAQHLATLVDDVTARIPLNPIYLLNKAKFNSDIHATLKSAFSFKDSLKTTNAFLDVMIGEKNEQMGKGILNFASNVSKSLMRNIDPLRGAKLLKTVRDYNTQALILQNSGTSVTAQDLARVEQLKTQIRSLNPNFELNSTKMASVANELDDKLMIETTEIAKNTKNFKGKIFKYGIMVGALGLITNRFLSSGRNLSLGTMIDLETSSDRAQEIHSDFSGNGLSSQWLPSGNSPASFIANAFTSKSASVAFGIAGGTIAANISFSKQIRAVDKFATFKGNKSAVLLGVVAGVMLHEQLSAVSTKIIGTAIKVAQNNFFKKGNELDGAKTMLNADLTRAATDYAAKIIGDPNAALNYSRADIISTMLMLKKQQSSSMIDDTAPKRGQNTAAQQVNILNGMFNLAYVSKDNDRANVRIYSAVLQLPMLTGVGVPIEAPFAFRIDSNADKHPLLKQGAFFTRLTEKITGGDDNSLVNAVRTTEQYAMASDSLVPNLTGSIFNYLNISTALSMGILGISALEQTSGLLRGLNKAAGRGSFYRVTKSNLKAGQRFIAGFVSISTDGIFSATGEIIKRTRNVADNLLLGGRIESTTESVFNKIGSYKATPAIRNFIDQNLSNKAAGRIFTKQALLFVGSTYLASLALKQSSGLVVGADQDTNTYLLSSMAAGAAVTAAAEYTGARSLIGASSSSFILQEEKMLERKAVKQTIAALKTAENPITRTFYGLKLAQQQAKLNLLKNFTSSVNPTNNRGLAAGYQIAGNLYKIGQTRTLALFRTGSILAVGFTALALSGVLGQDGGPIGNVARLFSHMDTQEQKNNELMYKRIAINPDTNGRKGAAPGDIGVIAGNERNVLQLFGIQSKNPFAPYLDAPNPFFSLAGLGVSFQHNNEKGWSLKGYTQIQLPGMDLSAASTNVPVTAAQDNLSVSVHEQNLSRLGGMNQDLKNGLLRRLARIGGIRKQALRSSGLSAGDQLSASKDSLIMQELTQRSYLAKQIGHQQSDQLSINFLAELARTNKLSGNDAINKLGNINLSTLIPSAFRGISFNLINNESQSTFSAFQAEDMDLDKQAENLNSYYPKPKDNSFMGALESGFNTYAIAPLKAAMGTALSSPMGAIAVMAATTASAAVVIPHLITRTFVQSSVGKMALNQANADLVDKMIRTRYNAYALVRPKYEGFFASSVASDVLYDKYRHIQYSLAPQDSTLDNKARKIISSKIQSGLSHLVDKEKPTNIHLKVNDIVLDHFEKRMVRLNGYNGGATRNNIFSFIRDRVQQSTPSPGMSQQTLAAIKKQSQLMEMYDQAIQKHIFDTFNTYGSMDSFRAVTPDIEDRIAAFKPFGSLAEDLEKSIIGEFNKNGMLSDVFIRTQQKEMIARTLEVLNKAPERLLGLETYTVNNFMEESGNSGNSVRSTLRAIGGRSTAVLRTAGAKISNRLGRGQRRELDLEERVALKNLKNTRTGKGLIAHTADIFGGIGNYATKAFDVLLKGHLIYSGAEVATSTLDPSATRFAKEKAVGEFSSMAFQFVAGNYILKGVGAAWGSLGGASGIGGSLLAGAEIVGAGIAGFFAAPGVAAGALIAGAVAGLAFGADAFFNGGRGRDAIGHAVSGAWNAAGRFTSDTFSRIARGATKIWNAANKNIFQPLSNQFVNTTTNILGFGGNLIRGALNAIVPNMGNNLGRGAGATTNFIDSQIDAGRKKLESNMLGSLLYGFIAPQTLSSALNQEYNQGEPISASKPFAFASFQEYSNTKYKAAMSAAIKDFSGTSVRNLVVSSEELTGSFSSKMDPNQRYFEGSGRVLSQFRGSVNSPSRLMMQELDLRGGLTGLKVYGPMLYRYALAKGIAPKRKLLHGEITKKENQALITKKIEQTQNLSMATPQQKKLDLMSMFNFFGAPAYAGEMENNLEKRRALITPPKYKNVLPSASERIKQYDEHYFDKENQNFFSTLYSSFKSLGQRAKRSLKEIGNKIHTFVDDRIQDLNGYGNPVSTTAVDRNTSGFKRWQHNSSLATPGFTEGVEAMSGRLGMNPNTVLAVMAYESNLSSSIRNTKSGASGLIQFMDSTASGLGTTTAKLRAMSPVDQLKYVELFLKNAGGKNKKQWEDWQVYAAVAAPAYISKGKDAIAYTKGSKAYEANKAWDVNKDGVIKAGEFIEAVKQSPRSKGFMSSGANTTQLSYLPGGENASSLQDMAKTVVGAKSAAVRDLIAFGKLVQKRFGYRVGEQSEFGGVTTSKHHHYGEADHYHDGSLDINSRAGTSALEQKELSVVRDMAKAYGFHTIFMSPTQGHYDHLHVDIGGYKPLSLKGIKTPTQVMTRSPEVQKKLSRDDIQFAKLDHARKLGEIVKQKNTALIEANKKKASKVITVKDVPALPLLQHEQDTYKKKTIPKVKVNKPQEGKLAFVEQIDSDMTDLVNGMGNNVAYNPMNDLS